MATVYFGNYYGLYDGNTGNWNQLSQWFATSGGFNPYTESFDYPEPLNRFPTEQDVIYFFQNVTSGFPSSWSGELRSARIGDVVTRNATGTWTGRIQEGVFYGSSSQLIVSPADGSTYINMFGGRLTRIPQYMYGVYLSGNAVYDGADVADTTGRIISLSETATFKGGINTIYTEVELNDSSTFNGNNKTITVGNFRTLRSDTPNTISILNCPTINVTSTYFSNGNEEQSPYNNPTFLNGILNIPTSTQFNCSGNVRIGTFYYFYSNRSGNTFIPSTVTLNCAQKLTITNANVQGYFTFTGNSINKKLKLSRYSTITQDISTSVINCYDYRIFSGTYTNSNNWVFGDSTTPALINIGTDITYKGDISPYFFLETLNTSKNITIYSNSTKQIIFNYPENYGYNTTAADARKYGKFSGLITILKTTTGNIAPVYVRGGQYLPIVTIPTSNSNSKFILSYSNWPASYGFGQDSYSIFDPTIYVNNLPSVIDTVATQL